MNLTESYKNKILELAGIDASIVAYHGTNKDFDAFDMSYAGSTSDPGDYGEGVYFDTDKGWAASYANKEVGIIITARINLTNPFVIDFVPYSEFNRKKSSGEIERNQIHVEIQRYIDTLNKGGANIDVKELLQYTNGSLTFLSISRKLGSKNITKYLLAAGHDGVIVNYGKSKEIAVFDTGKIEILKKESAKDYYKSLPIEEGYYNLPRDTFWAWVSPQNDFVQVPKLKHQGYIMQKYKNEPFGWDYDKVFDKAMKDGWIRVIYEYFPDRFKGELSLNGHSLERVKSVLSDIFLDKVKYGNNSIYVDSEEPKFSQWFSTATQDGKEKFLDFVISENIVHETTEDTLADLVDMHSKYKLRYPKNNVLIDVNINKLLSRHMTDEPDYAFDTKETSDYPGRVDRAKQFWQDFSKDQRYINPKTKERTNWGKVEFEAPYVTIENGKLGFADGRHRVIAMKELGYDNIIIEVPKSQVNLFKELQ